ncbi:MAG TPA: hypothetical protein VF384_19740 [Planctomycetota bacterium]
MLKELQSLLLRAMQQADPHTFLQAEVQRPGQALSSEERAMLAAIGDDGLRLTRLIVRKLRIDRLLRGDPAMAELCRSDPAAFARLFASYEAATPPRAVFPADEAQQFAAWRGQR